MQVSSYNINMMDFPIQKGHIKQEDVENQKFGNWWEGLREVLSRYLWKAFCNNSYFEFN